MSTTSKNPSELQLSGFTIYDRASYFAQFGKPAPPCDPGRRAKAWIGNGTFWFLESMTAPIVFKQETIPASDNLPNIEGAGPFSPYVIAPSGAWSTLNGTRTTQYNPLYLSLQADAQELMAQLGGSGLVDEGSGGSAPLSYDPTEQRREWGFLDNKGVMINAGALLFIRNMQGVGAPGHWDQSGAVPTWVPDNPVPDSTRPPLGPPCRALAQNESLQPTGIFGMATLIVDDGQPDANSTPASGGSYTQQDRDRDNLVLELLQQLAQK